MRIVETEIVKEQRRIDIGFKCDICDVIIENGRQRTDNFFIDYSAGYGTAHDGSRLQADICDNCLFDVIAKAIPNAKITNRF